MSKRGVSSHGVISQVNLIFASLQSIRNELQSGNKHARKKVWRGNKGAERRLCTLPVERRGGGEEPRTFCYHHMLLWQALFVSSESYLVQSLGSGFVGFSFFCSIGSVTKRHLCETCLKNPLQVL